MLVLACVRRLHISARDPAPLPQDGSLDHTVDWEERRNSNEDLLVLYGICKNYEALVVRCCVAALAVASAPYLTYLTGPARHHCIFVPTTLTCYGDVIMDSYADDTGSAVGD